MRFLIIIVAVVFLAGCSICEEAEENGSRDLLIVSKFNQLFEIHSEKIGQHQGIGEGDYWESKGLVYGRYVVDLSFKVRVAGDCSLSRESKPKIRVMEYYDYTREADGHENARGRMIGDLTEEEFMTLSTVDEIFGLIDVIPVKDRPIKSLENVLNFW